MGALLVLVVLVRLGLVSLDASLAIQPVWLMGLYALVLAVLAVGVLQSAAALWQVQSLPFRPGVTCSERRRRRHPLRPQGLSPVAAGPGRLPIRRGSGLTFPEGPSYELALRGAEHREQIATAITESAGCPREGARGQRKKLLASLDPLQDPGFVSPFAPTAQLVRVVPVWIRMAFVLAAALGAAVAAPIFYLRNAGSDSELLAKANRARSSEAYRAYLDRGGRRKDVKDILLPRAELAEAEKQGSVDAIEKYDAAHPNSQIKGEVAASLRKAMLLELNRTAEKGTVTALLDFKKRHPQKLVEPELGQAVHAVYKTSFDGYRKEASSYANVGAFVEKLLAYCEQKGPAVEIRFSARCLLPSRSPTTQVKKSPYFTGTTSYPSRYFDDDHARKREALVGKTFLARFGEAFPPDVLAFRMGEPLVDPEAPLPNVTVPTLFVVHTAQVSGASYLSNSPRGVFVGLGMGFEATFRIPDDTKPFKFKWSVWRPPDTTLSPSDQPFQEMVYDTMAGEVYRQFAQKYLAMFFKVTEPKSAP